MMNSSYEEALIKLMVCHLEEEGWRKETNCPPGWKARPSSNDTTGVEMEFLSPSMEVFPGILEMLTYSKQVANDSEDMDKHVDASNTIDKILDDPNTMDVMENDLSRGTLAPSLGKNIFLQKEQKEPTIPTVQQPSTSKPKNQALSSKSLENMRSSPPLPTNLQLEKRKALTSSSSSKKPRMEPKVKMVPSPKKPSTKSGFEIRKATMLDLTTTSDKLSLPPIKATPLAPSPSLPRVDSSLQITKVHKKFSKTHIYFHLCLMCICVCICICYCICNLYLYLYL